jgi:hypothetical protein
LAIRSASTGSEKTFAAMPAERARTMYGEEQQRTIALLPKLKVPASIIEQMFAYSSRSMHYLTPAELWLMQSTPYLEELTDARCGTSQGKTMRQGDNLIYTNDAGDKTCQ